MLGHSYPVYEIVSGHNRPGLCFAGDFKRLNINFPQRSFVHLGAYPMPRPFAIVRTIVFERASHVHTLHAFYVLFCKLARNQRVLGKIFEISAAGGQSFYVHARRKQYIDLLFYTVVAETFAHFISKRRIPGLRKHLKRGISHGFYTVVLFRRSSVNRLTKPYGTV